MALLHYLALKTTRDRSVVALLLFPVIAGSAPLLGVAAYQLVRGRPVYPMTFDPRVPPAETAFVLMTTGAMASVFMAGIAAFWFLRVEVADRSIGSLVLAARTHLVSLSVTLYGAAVGFAAFVLAAGGTKILTGQLSRDWKATMLTVACCSVVAAAMGFLALTISSETSMLVPLMGAIIVMGVQVGRARPELFLFSALAAPVLLVIASTLLERRCAA